VTVKNKINNLPPPHICLVYNLKIPLKSLISVLIVFLVFSFFAFNCSSDSKKPGTSGTTGKTCPTEPPPDGFGRICGNLALASNISQSNLENSSVYVVGQEENGVKSESDGYFEVLVELEVSGSLATKTGAFKNSFFDTTDFEPGYKMETKADQYKNYQLITLSLNEQYGITLSEIEFLVGSDTSAKTKDLGNIVMDVLFDVSTAPGQNMEVGNVNMKKTGSIQGVVTLENKTDHTGIDVYIPGTSFMAKTDDTGSFAMTGVPEGTYQYVRSEKDGYLSSVKTDIVVNSDEVTTVEDQMLPLSTGSVGWVLINDGAETTTFQNVTLTIGYTDTAVLMWLTEDKFFFTGGWQPVQDVVEYEFVGLGEKTIYIKFADANGLESPVYFDSIEIIEETEPIIICLFDDADKAFDSGCVYK